MTVTRILETALYVDDLPRSVRFYRDLFGFPVLFEDGKLTALDVSGQSVLLLFLRGGSLQPSDVPGGRIPAHNGEGPLHMAFAIAAADLPEWEAKLAARGLLIESTVEWPRGGRSLYFRDPDNNAIELATPGIWATY